jgi:hypothetical protein
VAVANAQLAVDGATVRLHGVERPEELFGDLAHLARLRRSGSARRGGSEARQLAVGQLLDELLSLFG